jgi:cell division inhibitor SepF
MAERLKRAAAWLGLVTDDRYADYDDVADFGDLTEDSADEPLGTPDKPATVTPLESRRPVPVAAAAGPTLAPHPRTADMSRIMTVHPRTYNEARIVGEHFRDGVPVIMNLSDMEDVDAKRLVDFAAGLIFGLRGSIERVTSKVFLLSPHDVTVAAEDKERIAGGFFNQS